MKNKFLCLGRLLFISFVFLFMISTRTTPAFTMAKGNGVDVSLIKQEVSETVHYIELSCDPSPHPLHNIPSFLIGDPINECPSSFEKKVVHFVNHERSLVGLPPLELDVRLQAAARWMSHDMAVKGLVPTDHVDSLGRTFDVRVSDEGGYPYMHLGEVIAGGFPSPESVVNAWMNSPGHRDRILDPDYEHIGVGYTYDSSTDHWYYWTANIGSTIEPRQTPVLNCNPRFHLLFLHLIEK